MEVVRRSLELLQLEVANLPLVLSVSLRWQGLLSLLLRLLPSN